MNSEKRELHVRHRAGAKHRINVGLALNQHWFNGLSAGQLALSHARTCDQSTCLYRINLGIDGGRWLDIMRNSTMWVIVHLSNYIHIWTGGWRYVGVLSNIYRLFCWGNERILIKSIDHFRLLLLLLIIYYYNYYYMNVRLESITFCCGTQITRI